MEKTVKSLQFWYIEDYDDPIRKETVPRERIAYQGDTVDIASKADLARGEENGDFYTDEELARFGATPEAPESSSPAGAPDFDTASAEDIADWMDETDATIPDLLELANDNPDVANKILEAENIARSDDPRKGLVEGMTKILQRASE